MHLVEEEEQWVQLEVWGKNQGHSVEVEDEHQEHLVEVEALQEH